MTRFEGEGHIKNQYKWNNILNVEISILNMTCCFMPTDSDFLHSKRMLG